MFYVLYQGESPRLRGSEVEESELVIMRTGRTRGGAELCTHSAGAESTPNSHHKIQVFSDPTLGKSWRRRQTTYQTKVSGQPNPWTKSCEGECCDGNWVYGHDPRRNGGERRRTDHDVVAVPPGIMIPN